MKIYAVMVAYNPDENRFCRSIESLLYQVDRIIVVNNGRNPLDLNIDGVEVVELGENKGIAYAQNRGIEICEAQKADYVLLSDQDTVYPNRYIESFSYYLNSSDADVFCPVFYDNIKGVYSPIMTGKFRSIEKSDVPLLVAHAIASGSLIRTDIFRAVGKMDEDLFIDYVDFEWCWRATSKGKRILTVPSVVISHNLGDGTKKILWKEVTLRSDFRYFYILRNGYFLSFHCRYLTLPEKLHLFMRTVSFSVGVLLLRHNFKIVRIIFKAFLLGISGKFHAGASL